MSYFLILSVPRSRLADLPFGPEFQVEDVSASPIGRAATGGRVGSSAYLVTVDGCSTDVLVRGERRNDRRAEFLRGVEALLQREHAVSLLIHWARGAVRQEPATLRHREKIAYPDLTRLFPHHLEEDAPYVILRDLTP